MTNHKITTQEVENILGSVLEDGRIEIVDEEHSIVDVLNAVFIELLCKRGWEIGDGKNADLNEIYEEFGLNYEMDFHKDYFPIGGIYDIYTLSVHIAFDIYIEGDPADGKPPENYMANVMFFQFRNVEGVDDMMQIGDHKIIVPRGDERPIYNGKNFVFRLTDFCEEIMKKILIFENGFTKSLALEPCRKEQTNA